MSRTIPRVLVAIAVVAAAATTAGCGDDGTAEACNALKLEVQSLAQTAGGQLDDPETLALTVRSSSVNIRTHGEEAGGDVESAATEVADALEQLSNSIADGSWQNADLAAVSEAGQKIRAACPDTE